MSRFMCRHSFVKSVPGFFNVKYPAHFLSQSSRLKSSGDGYIVLLPEIPRQTPASERLMDATLFPPYNEITKDNCSNASAKTTQELGCIIHKLEDDLSDPNFPKSYDNVITPLEEASVNFEYVWSIVKSLNIVKNKFISSEGYNVIHDRSNRARSKKYQSSVIYHACKEIKADNRNLNEPQQRVVDKYLLEGELSGLELTGNQKASFLGAAKKLADTKEKFKDNVDATTSKFRQLLIDPKYVGEMPVHLLKMFAKDKNEPKKGPWLVTLYNPNYKTFLEYCPESALRWNTWQAYHGRASGVMEKNTNNSINMEEIRSARKDQARLLGYENYAELSMKTKMAGTVLNVDTMLASLLEKARRKQVEELENLEDFAASRGNELKLKPWDFDFWRRKQRTSLFNVDMTCPSEYFPLPYVLNSLIKFSENMFNIKFRAAETPVWHEDVDYYDVYDASNDTHYGGIYIDPYYRPGDKLSVGSWVLNTRNRQDSLGIKPLTTLVFNFLPPMYGRQSLLSFQDLYVLFEKFGHALHQVLTEIPYSEVAGTNNIEWDAVMFPAKFMSMWLGNKEIVKSISSHCDNGEKIPDDMMRGLLRAKKHMTAFDLCHELYLSALDIQLHTKKEFWADIVKQTWKIYKPYALDKKDAHLCWFSAIFSGDFAAAYYTSLWSHMLAADAYYYFIETSKTLKDRYYQGSRFRSNFFASGGGVHPGNAFREFRGRDPCPDAFLWSLGLGEKPKPQAEAEKNEVASTEEKEKEKAKMTS